VVGGTNRRPVIYTSLVKDAKFNESGDYEVSIGVYYQFKGFNLAFLNLTFSPDENATHVEYSCGVKSSFRINIYVNLILVMVCLVLATQMIWFFGFLFIVFIITLRGEILSIRNITEGLVDLVTSFLNYR
jgi:hypothetical protein